MTEPARDYHTVARRLGPEGHVDSEGYLQLGRAQRQPTSVTIACGRREAER